MDRSLTRPGGSAAGPCVLRPARAAALLALLASVPLGAVTLSGSGAPGARSVAPAPALRPPALTALSPPFSRASSRGGGAHAYAVHGSAVELVAANPAQRLRIGFDSAGVRLRAGSLEETLGLRAIGYGGSLAPVAPGTPRASANRVTYARAGTGEWYANTPAGLEQGFTLARAPAAAGQGPLTIALALAGNARAVLSAGGQSLTLTHPGAPPLRYGELHATDAGGHSLRTWLALGPRALLLRVDTHAARWPLRVDPLVAQAGRLTGGPEEVQAGVFGASVALAANGTTALVGAPRGRGVAWAFSRTGSVWQRGPELQGPKERISEVENPCEEEEGENGGCGFGASVALSADGNTALVGSPRETRPCPPPLAEPCSEQGAAWVFTRSGGSWTQQAVLLGGSEEGISARFGRDVALSADGNTALVGAPADRNHGGAVWAFTRSGSSWSQQGAKLAPAGEVGEGHFGYALKLSADGNTALIGAPGDTGYRGAAWPFTRTGATWTQGEELTGAGEIGAAHFGASVALSSNSELALLGGFRDNGEKGAVWSFTHPGATWTAGEKLIGRGESGGGWFGFRVALSASGALALIGAPNDSSNSGAAWAFTHSGIAWGTQAQKLTGAEEAAAARFGRSVALSSDGLTVLIGGPFEADRLGAVWAFAHEKEVEPPTEEENPTGTPPSVARVAPGEGPASGGTQVLISGSHLEAASAVHFGAAPATIVGVSATKLTVISPAHAAGTVDVVVSAGGLSSRLAARDQFTFTASAGPEGELPGGPPPGTGGAGGTGVQAFGPIVLAPVCRPSLAARTMTVTSKGRTSVKLLLAGGGACRGRLALTVRQKLAHHRTRTRTIAAGTFSLLAGRTVLLALKLNALGRSLLHAGHGRLSASLSVVRLSPGPVQAHSAGVRLALQSVHRGATKH
jgi:hypothetical protein